MEGIIILAHGSKKKDTEEIAQSLARKVKINFQDPIKLAFLQLSDSTIEKAVAELYETGVRVFKIVPMFIFDGIHITEDIPSELDRIKDIYKDITIKLGRCIGDDDKLAEIVTERINELC
ncbi:sirohydrochlorin chelatase [Clostridium cellulovorans]|uniref:Cobalamin (Vitamin B12) biosynthesis CbiX protein n=1 Tax=Clostridium cellulovorans (strain ATCC 35296 / DSM 3052 / OCM 3 / 743B) TaxID=573061 RepID=D9SP00_CLOC7|nr:CbiX/SirB N-terminal domain-containing protein [Clostridium cellulovorans]ADL51965.1 cobalamin (vitamin B12) biosynthesis CbiX protein [Clostridium cellulovorans 743B]